MLNGSNVYFIIFRMCSEPFYLNGFKFKHYSYNQSVLITHYIKDYAVIGNQAGISVHSF